MNIKAFILRLLPRNKAFLKLELQFLAKLNKKIDSDLIFLYGGLHPKHLFYTRHGWVEQFIDKDDIVLDIASGTGCCAYQLSTKCQKVIGIDFQKPLNQYLGKENLQFQHGDILKIVPNLKDSYSFAVAFHILEHLDNPVEFLKTVKADKIAVIVPHEENWFTTVRKDLDLNWKGDITHRRLYNHNLLRNQLQDAGYVHIRLLEFDGDNGLRALASRTVQ